MAPPTRFPDSANTLLFVLLVTAVTLCGFFLFSMATYTISIPKWIRMIIDIGLLGVSFWIGMHLIGFIWLFVSFVLP
ncbi:MAG: hypothetical protein KC996_00210 [Phycisphaerales bacterium]|nr:hypothetical protein [Phycisphaerales bacterium]